VDIDCQIASDNVAGAELATQYIVDTLGENVKTAELVGTSGASAAIDRSQGFHNIADKKLKVVASQTVLPVIGVPISGSVLDGQDALYSIVQMPSGIPVATVAINGAKNAAYLALQIIGVQHKEVQEKLLAERKQMEESAMKANEEVIAKYN
jgi:DNA-binding LacI/PurR family transcriptional regulator